MGTTASSFDTSQSRSSSRNSNINQDCDKIVVSRKFMSPKCKDLSTGPNITYFTCNSEKSLISNPLPGQVDDISPYDEISTTENSCSTSSSKEVIAVSDYAERGIATNGTVRRRKSSLRDVLDTTKDSFNKKPGPVRSFDSLSAIEVLDRKRFPVLAVSERPKRIKSAMLESLKVVVPSLKRINSGRKFSRSKTKGKPLMASSSTNVLQFSNQSNVVTEEALGDFILTDFSPEPVGDVEENEICVVEKVNSSDSFSTVALFRENLGNFDRQRVLSRVDEVDEEI